MSYLFKVERYNDNAFRIIRIHKSSKKDFNNLEGVGDNDILSHDTSISRTKRNIRRICLSNGFEYFATWTVDSKLCDRYSLTAVVEKMKSLLKEFQRRYKEFKYIYIIEEHKDGAFHFHGMIKNVPRSCLVQYKLGDKMTKKIAEQVKNGAIIYHIPFFDERLGVQNTFTKINSLNKCSNYIIKYMSKKCVETTENQRYFCSRGLSKGESYEVKFIPAQLFDNQDTYSYDDICDIRDIYFDKLSKSDMLYFKDIKDKENFLRIFIDKYYTL